MVKKTNEDVIRYRAMKGQIESIKTLFRNGEKQLLSQEGMRLGNPNFMPSWYQTVSKRLIK